MPRRTRSRPTDSTRRGTEITARAPDSDRTTPFAVDVEDRGDTFVVSAALPGVRKQDVDVSVRKHRVAIVADFGDGPEGILRRTERPRGEVRRVIHLPEAVVEKRASASFDDGVLRVRLPKRHRPKRVPVE